MATRIYLGNLVSGAGLSPTFGAGWHRNADADRRFCGPKKFGTAMASKNVITSTAETVSFCLNRQYLSDPMVAMTLSGTLKGQLRALESNAGLNATSAIRVAICNEDGTNIREVVAIAASDLTTSTPPEYATSLTNRRFQNSAESASISLTSTTVNEKDRLILEIGIRESNTTANRNADQSFGDDSATDLAEDDTTTTADNPWIEFTANIVFRSVSWQPNYPPVVWEKPEANAYGLVVPKSE